MIKTNYIYEATILNVVDGDTVDAEVDLGFDVLIRTRFRLNGIDTPERNALDPQKRALAAAATEFLKRMTLNKSVTIVSHKQDKYGRYLADIYIEGVHANQRLLDEGYAVKYM